MMRLLGQCLLLNLVFGTTFFLRSGDLGVGLNLINLTWNMSLDLAGSKFKVKAFFRGHVQLGGAEWALHVARASQ